MQRLVEGLALRQRPEPMFFTCADSRVDPDLLAQRAPGVCPADMGGGERTGRMKARLLAAVLFALCATPTFAVEKKHYYGHLPIHVRGTLQGWQAHEDVFYGRAGQRVLIQAHSVGMKWLVISVTQLSAKTPVFSSGETRGRSGEVTLPHDGAYKLKVTIRPDGARLGRRVDFRIDVTAASHVT